MKKFNVGIIGYSWSGRAHIEAINNTDLAQVTSIYSSRQHNDEEISALHGSKIKCYTDLDEMLANPDIHIVSVCSYPHDRAKQAIAAARAGKHMIIEKPLALSWDDCLAIESAVKEAGVKACVCFEARYAGQIITTKALIDSGLLGKLHYGEVDYYHGIGPWNHQYRWNIKKESGGSSLLSAGCHAMDALFHFMGNEFENISSYATYSENKDFKKYEYPTSSVSIVKFKNGTVGKVASILDCFQPYYFRVHLIGSEGSLFDNKFYSTKLGALDSNQWSKLSMNMIDSGDASDHPYQAEFEVFFKAVDENREMPLTSLSEALISFKAIFAADESEEKSR